ncbi:MAG: DUF433 domain-containing protein [Holophaga sp.]|nr:DUF433 domain-containing protein [Holophaga sp.]
MVSGGGTRFDPAERIVRDPSICAGQPTLPGTRILLRVVLGYLAQGESAQTILESFPGLREAHLRACIAFAAAQAAEVLPR